VSRAGRRRLAATLVAALPVAALAAPPPGLRDARVEETPGVTPAAAIERLGGAAAWVGWSVPAVPEARDLCCWRNDFRVRGCSLADRDTSWGSSDDRPAAGPTELMVLVEVAAGRPARLRLLSPDCPVDGAGRRLVWLGPATPAASLDLLERLAGGGDDDVGEPALAAIAHHLDGRATAILERRALDRAAPRESREHALFWAAQTRGEAGVRLATRVLDSDPDSELREHALFALTQSAVPAAIERVKRAAIDDRDPEVRGQALFWLAQSEAAGAGEWILGRLDAERDEEVREQAVFALSQLDDGAEWLLRVVRSRRDADVRRQALFWLGQSDDPRALDELTSILEK
jgi:hypothetical protein